MSVPVASIPEFDDVVERGSPERRATTLKRITAFFLDGASRFNEDHLRLFDDLLGRLVAEIDNKERAELSSRLAPVGNAPLGVVRQLAKNDDIAVAGPVLERSSRLTDADLLDIARTASPAHLLAIAGRTDIAAPVTDVLVERGDAEVTRGLVENRGAKLSDDSFTKLVAQAEHDAELAERIGLRPDVPPNHFRDLLLQSARSSTQREATTAKAEHATSKSSEPTTSTEPHTEPAPRDNAPAQQLVEILRRDGKAREADLVDFARQGRRDETIAALASLCAVPIGVVDRLMGGVRPDPILILGKSAGWDWPTVRALIVAQHGGNVVPSQSLDNASMNFERLSPATAKRVMRFWQVRRAEDR